jgi:hypothetical protein
MKFVALIFIAFSAHAYACDVQIVKTIIPLNQQLNHTLLCADQYFEKRSPLTLSADDESGMIFQDPIDMVFYDMILFESPLTLPLEEEGRLQLIDTLFESYKRSLKNHWGTCELKIQSNARDLSLADFHIVSRTEGGQPGTRRMLTKDDVEAPSWQVLCPTSDGQMKIFKSGSYFFVFVDVYENKTLSKTKAHMAKFLFSFR